MHEYLAKVFRLGGLSLALAAAPALADEPRGPTPLGNPGSWATTEDYPAVALREMQEGIARFTVAVGKDGTVTTCTITQSSGSDALDRKTCELVTLRARFSPATDPAGKATEGNWSSSIRWQIPKDAFPPEPSLIVFSMLVGADGSMSDCHFERIDGAPMLADKKVGEPETCRASKFDMPYRDAKGNPVAKRVRFTSQVEVLDASPPSVTVKQ